jgi:RHS repeat-associated protein
VPLLVPGSTSDAPWTKPQPTTQDDNGTAFQVYQYRPRVEGSFARVELWRSVVAPSDVHWRTFTRDNVTSVYGRDNQSRIYDPNDPDRIFEWLICEQTDRGNATIFVYKPEDSANVENSVNERNRSDKSRSANIYLKHILYGNVVPTYVQPDLGSAQWLFEIVFDYGEHDAHVPLPSDTTPWLGRNDAFSSYRAGFEIRTYRLCQRVLVFHHFPEERDIGANLLVQSMGFSYRSSRGVAEDTQKGNPNVTFLESITTAGYLRTGDSYLKRTMPPLEFSYSDAIMDSQIHTVDSTSLENLPVGLDESSYQLVDLDGEGISGILTDQDGAWLYKRNNGNGLLGPAEVVYSKPSLANIKPGSTQALMDLAGDGFLDVVDLNSANPGFSKRTFDNGWEAFCPFNAMPNIDWTDANLQLADMTGDGLPDILIVEPTYISVYQSLGEAGFAMPEQCYPSEPMNEESNPILTYADQNHAIFIADMTGDGLADLVMIRNGGICYWPCLGYGRFGSKVTMSQAPWFEPPDAFDALRIRMGDIDGSGTTDIIYFTANGFVAVYINQSGNSYADVQRLQTFPPFGDLATVKLVDFLGKGTSCLVWSSPLPGDQARRISYIDLVKGTKPNMLVSYKNNFGSETTLTYTPSTTFYLKDRASGTPWLTRIPFPVQVLERVELFDHVSKTYFSTRYSYAHGYYDGIEREFRGFGRVEQWDTEEYNLDMPVSNVDAASFVPPVHTKTWYHTGAYIRAEQVSQFYSPEYYREPGLTDDEVAKMRLSNSVLQLTDYVLSETETRQAVRTLQGSMLRQEIYGLDGTTKEGRPYTVSESNYAVQMLQPQATNIYAVFLVQDRESISFQYDRQLYKVSPSGVELADPRVTQSLTLAVDIFGNTTLALAVGHGRRHDDPSTLLTPDDKTLQKNATVTMSVLRYTNPVSDLSAYRTPLLCESQLFEVINLPIAPSDRITPLVKFSDAVAAAQALVTGLYDFPFEDFEGTTVPAGQLSQRPLAHKRVVFRSDDMTKPLDLGLLQPQALPYQTYSQVLTPGLVQQTYVAKLAEPALGSALEQDCGLVHSEGDANWWNSSGQIFFSPNPADSPADELAYARRHFYLPTRFRDPLYTSTFRAESVAKYDKYDLLVVETRDALDNRLTVGIRDVDPQADLVQVGYDYRVLAPVLVMDPNRNLVAASYDALGMLVANAMMGKPGSTDGDQLSGLEPNLTDAEIQAYFSNPLDEAPRLLSGTTSRLVYDLFSYYRTQGNPSPQPAVVATMMRVTHVSDLGPGEQTQVQQTFSYVDGGARMLQKKALADPDPDTRASRWISTGWAIFNNKGNAVRKYEPFFTDSNQYESNATEGVSSVVFYDPVQRVAGSLHPDHSWTKTVFGCWMQETWDANDTLRLDAKTDDDVGIYFARLQESEYLPSWYDARISGARGPQDAQAASKAAVNAATQGTVYLDSLGRSLAVVSHQIAQRSSDPTPSSSYLVSRVSYDTTGNSRKIFDTKGHLVETRTYDMLGGVIHSSNMDSGEVWTMYSVKRNGVYAWGTRGFRFRKVFDVLNRLSRTFLQDDIASEILYAETAFGEGKTGPESLNLRGKAVRSFDQAGVEHMEQYDFKGNLLSGYRQLATSYNATLDWTQTPSLESDKYSVTTSFDALNRPTLQISPDTSRTRSTYGMTNQILEVEVDIHGTGMWQPYVTNTAYNARNQRTLIQYGNGAQTKQEFDPDTFRLTSLTTIRDPAAFPQDCVRPFPVGWPGCQVQSLSYTYDILGNITYIRDDAQQMIYFQNQRVEPSNDYTYDSLSQLIEATGREHLAQVQAADAYGPHNSGLVNLQHPNNGNAMGRYVERYFYDESGNLLSLQHSRSSATSHDWTRHYVYSEKSLLDPTVNNNRLSSTSIGSLTENYTYDGLEGQCGCVTSMPHLSIMKWDFKEQLQATATQTVSSGTPETSWYVYNNQGQRIRKITETQAAPGSTPKRRAERIYLGVFEIYRKYNPDGIAISLERQTLRIGTGSETIALIEMLTQGSEAGRASKVTRYQLGNHLGSICLELDDQARIFSYEEYAPFGQTSYQAVASQTQTPKRYRFANKERDHENGFYYNGLRYLAPWLGRWISCDPGGLIDGPNLYSYVNNNPVGGTDPSGTQTAEFTANEAGELYKSADEVPEDLSTERPPSPELQFKQQGRLIAEAARQKAARKEAADHPPLTKKQQAAVAGRALRNEAVDLVQSLITMSKLARVLTPSGLATTSSEIASGTFTLNKELQFLKVPGPPSHATNLREAQEIDNYEAMTHLTTTLNVAATILPIGLAGNGAKAALGAEEMIAKTIATEGEAANLAVRAEEMAGEVTAEIQKMVPHYVQQEGAYTPINGPGKFGYEFQNMSEDALKYEVHVAQKVPERPYMVNDVSFDGFPRGLLVDAKYYQNTGRTARLLAQGNFSTAWRLLGQANRQVQAAGGAAIEWRVSGDVAANILDQMFKLHEIPISVKWFPAPWP